MRRLQRQLCLEGDPGTKQDLFEHLFLLMAARWRQLVGSAAEEQDPVRLNAIIGELNAILRERRTAIETSLGKAPALTEERASSNKEDEVAPLRMTASSSR